MKNDLYKQDLNNKTGEFLSRKPRKLRIGYEKDNLVPSSQAPSIKSYPQRATSREFRSFILATTLTILSAQEAYAEEKQDKILDIKKSDDIFKARYEPPLQPNSTRPIFKNKPRDVYQSLIETHRDNFLAQPNKAINFESFPEEILSGFLNQKNFNHKDNGPLTFVTYLAYHEQEQANFLGILKHSVTNSRKNIDLLNLLTSQVDDKGNNLLHISCIANNTNHLDAIFQNFNSAHFSFSDQKSAIDKLKKDMIMKFNDDQFTPLMQAVKDNQSEIVDKILSNSKSFDKDDYSFDVLMQVNQSGNSALQLALQNKNYKLIESLLVNFDSYNSEQKAQIKNVFKNSNNQIATDLSIASQIDIEDNAIQILKTLKKINYSKDELKDLLTTKDGGGDSAFLYLAFFKKPESIIEIIKEFDGANPEDVKLLKEIFLQKNPNGNSALNLLIEKNTDDKIAGVIDALKKINFDKSELKDLLTTEDGKGNSAFLLLAFCKKPESILEIIKEFDGNNPEDVKLLKEIFLQKNANGNSVLNLLIEKNPDDKIAGVIDALKNINFDKSELRDLLTTEDGRGNSAFSFLAIYKKPESILEIIKDFDGTNPEEVKLLKEIFLQKNAKGNSALNLLIHNNPDDKIAEFIAVLKKINFDKSELKNLLTTTDDKGNSAFLLLAFSKKTESILEIIKEFDGNNPEDVKLLKEIFLQKNLDGDSALNLLFIENSDDKIAGVIYALKKINFDKSELKNLLTTKDGKGNSPFSFLVDRKKTESILEIIKEFDGTNPEDVKLLKEIFLQNNVNGYSALNLLIYNNPDDKIAEFIAVLKKINFDKSELKDLLTTEDGKGSSAFLYLAFFKKPESFLKIIKEFDGNNPEDVKLLKEIFLQKNLDGDSALNLFIPNNTDDKIAEFIDVLKEINFDKSELKNLLLDENKGGASLIDLIFRNEKIKSILSLVSAFDIEDENDKKHLKEIFLKKKTNGYSALYYLVDKINNDVAFECIKKIISIFSNEEIEKFLTERFKENPRVLPISTILLLAGNDKFVEEVLKRDVEIKIDELPYSYYSLTPNVAVYYLETFRKDENSQIKEIKYYNSNNQAGVDILNLRLNDDRDDPLIVEIIANDDSSRKAIITETSINNIKSKTVATNLNLQNTFNLAESKKIDQIIINLNIYLYTFPIDNAHEITIKLSKSDDGWDIVYHDPNSLSKFPRPIEWKQTNEDTIKAICDQNNIKIKSITEHENIVTNDRLGSCDTIASIVAASMIIGDDHSQKLAQKCKEYFSYVDADKSQILSVDNCIHYIGGEVLNKEVKSILEAKLKLIESKMAKSPSSIILPGDKVARINDNKKEGVELSEF